MRFGWISVSAAKCASSAVRSVGIVGVVGLGDVQDQLIDFERVVVALAEFDLPGADVRGVVEDVFEVIEIDERAFEFVELQVAHVGAARDFADEARDVRAAEAGTARSRVRRR